MPKRCGSSSPCEPSPKNISHHFGQLLVGCCVPPFSRRHQNPRPHCSLKKIFRRSIRCSKRRVNILPTRSSPAASTPLFCSLLCRPNERRPSKTGALPISDDCRWRRRKSEDTGVGGNVDSGTINGRPRMTAAEDRGGGFMRCNKGEDDIILWVSFLQIPMYAYTSSARFVHAHRNSISGE